MLEILSFFIIFICLALISSSLDLLTSKRFTFFFLGGPAVLFLPLYCSEFPAGL